MSLDRPWLQSYPKGVPAEIDVNEFHSVASVFDASVAKFRDRPAYSSFGKVLTYGETDALVEQFAAYLLGELKLKKVTASP
jgi:long-chain acyl-CoA synthetase